MDILKTLKQKEKELPTLVFAQENLSLSNLDDDFALIGGKTFYQ